MNKAQLNKFSDIAKFNPGQSPESKFYSKTNGTPFLQGNSTFKNLFPLINTFTSKITKLADINDILISVRAPVGDLNIANKKICIGRGIGSIKAKDGDNRFLYYCLKYNIRNLLKQGSGTTYKAIDKEIINKFDLILPTSNETKKFISKFFYNLDIKIEVNNSIIKKLYILVENIFKFWFFQYEFHQNDNNELNKNMPKDWSYVKLYKFEEKIITGKTPSTKIKDNFNGNVPFICIDDVRGNIHIFNTRVKLSDKGANSQIKKFLPKNSICVTCIATPGLVGLTTEKSQTNQQINSIVCSENENVYYLYFYLREYLKNTKAKPGNTFANMNKGDFSDILVLKPKKEILLEFHNCIDNYMKKIYQLEEENIKLEKLKEYLLPKFMTGQIDIS